MNQLEKFPVYHRARNWLSTVRWHHLILGALCFGIALRLIHFGFGRMLWLDEATIALNFVSGDGGDFFQPLDYRQFAPPIWMIVSDGFWTVTQNFEYGARLPSFLAGLAAFILFWRMVQERFSPAVVFITVFAFAFSYMPVYYSAEIKPYVFDLLLSVLLLLQGLRLLEKPNWPLKDTAILGLTFIAGSCFAMGAPMVIGGIGGVLGMKALLERRWTAVIIIALSGAIAGLIYLVPALSAFQIQIDNSGFDQGGTGHFFNRHFAPFPPTSLGDLAWYVEIVQDTLTPMVGRESAYSFVIMLVLGSIIVAKRSAWKAALILSPIVVGFLFAAAQVYPIISRLALYVLPIAMLMAAYTLEKLISELPHRTSWIVFCAVLLMNIGSVTWYRYNDIFTPTASPKDISDELKTIANEIEPEEMLVVTAWTLPAFLLYRHAHDLDQVNWTVTDRAECFFTPPINIDERRRIWFLRGPFEGPGPVPASETIDLVFSDSVKRLGLSTSGQRLERVETSSAEPQALAEVSCPQRRVKEVYLMGGRPPTLVEN